MRLPQPCLVAHAISTAYHQGVQGSMAACVGLLASALSELNSGASLSRSQAICHLRGELNRLFLHPSSCAFVVLAPTALHLLGRL